MSDEILNDMASVKTAVEGFEKALVATEEVHKKSAELRAEDKAEIDRIAVDAAANVKKMNELELALNEKTERVESLEKRHEFLERIASRGGSESKGVKSAQEIKNYETTRKFLAAETPGIEASMMGDMAQVSFENACGILKSLHPYASEELIQKQAKTWNEGTNTEGGYFVRPEIANFFITRDLNSGSLRPWSNSILMGSNELLIPIDDDISKRATWAAELDKTTPQPTAEIGQGRLILKKLQEEVATSRELLSDAFIDAEQFIVRKLNERFELSENDAFINGNGANEIKGLLQYADWSAPGVYTRDAIERIETETALTLEYNDMINMFKNVIPVYQGNSRWFMGQNAWGEVLKIKSLDGVPLITTNNSLRESPVPTVLGRPVTLLNQMPDAETGGALIGNAEPIIFGDMTRSHTIGNQGGMLLIRDIYTNKPCINFMGMLRVGSLLTNFEALKILKIQP